PGGLPGTSVDGCDGTNQGATNNSTRTPRPPRNAQRSASGLLNKTRTSRMRNRIAHRDRFEIERNGPLQAPNITALVSMNPRNQRSQNEAMARSNPNLCQDQRANWAKISRCCQAPEMPPAARNSPARRSP